MKVADPEILRRIESLTVKIGALGKRATKTEQKERADYAQKYLQAMGQMVLQNEMIFTIEPWHPLQDNLALPNAGEMLLRVKDSTGAGLPPYPAIMTFYHNGFTEEIDSIVCACALNQFRQGPDRQVTINISCRSLQNADFVKSALARLESINLQKGEKIIFEIHESNAVVKMSDATLALFRKFGVGFAIDDVGLSMNDVFRLSAFENVADYIKLDRQSVGAHPDNPRSLVHILSLAHSFLPKAHMVAEGVKSAEHAQEILRQHPDIRYVQGMRLPDRETFQREWRELQSKHH